MDTNPLDRMIEEQIRDFSLKAETSQAVMERINEYEVGKSRIRKSRKIILSLYIGMTSLFSLIFLGIAANHHRSILSRINLEVITSILQGILVLVILTLFGFWLFTPSTEKCKSIETGNTA